MPDRLEHINKTTEPLWMSTVRQLRKCRNIGEVSRILDDIPVSKREEVFKEDDYLVSAALHGLKVRQLDEAEQLISKLKDKYDLTPGADTVADLVQKNHITKGHEIANWFNERYDIQKSHPKILEALIAKSNPVYVDRLIEKYIPAGTSMPENVLVRALEKYAAKTARKRLREWKSKYELNIGEKIVTVFLNARNMHAQKAVSIVDSFIQEYQITPTDGMLSLIVKSADSTTDIQGLLNELGSKYGAQTVGLSTLNVALSRNKYLSDAEYFLDNYFQKYNVTPSLGTYKVLFFKLMSSPKPSEKSLNQARAIAERLQKSGEPLAAMRKSMPMHILYARYLFMEGRLPDAVVELTPLLQTIKTGRSRIVIAAMIFAFMPESNPLRVAMSDNLARTSQADLELALSSARNFNEVFNAWLEEENQKEAQKFGGGTIFDDLHDSAIDRKALRDVLPFKNT